MKKLIIYGAIILIVSFQSVYGLEITEKIKCNCICKTSINKEEKKENTSVTINLDTKGLEKKIMEELTQEIESIERKSMPVSPFQ